MQLQRLHFIAARELDLLLTKNIALLTLKGKQTHQLLNFDTSSAGSF